jgi:formate dehydrogenase subunit gamma
LLLIAALAIALFYYGKGTMKLHGAETGRKIERFTPLERSAHWTNAIAFVLLAVLVRSWPLVSFSSNPS